MTDNTEARKTMPEQEFDSPEDVLNHYGVLGMKWGRTRVRATGPQIRQARRNLQRQSLSYHDHKADVKRATSAGEKAAAREKLDQVKADFLKNPDRVVAARLTRGEKAVAAILLPYGMTAIATTSVISRRIEYKQDKGRYGQ